jgi:hypothetical protein
MQKTRVLVSFEKDEIAQVKAFCKEEGFQFGAWARKVILEAAGLKEPKGVAE